MYGLETIKKMNEERCAKYELSKSNLVQRIAKEISLNVRQSEALKDSGLV
jgi:hypothetical protein